MVMSIYDFDDYKEYVAHRFRKMPGNGRGELQKLASFLRMHSTRISHVFRGTDHPTLEQGLGIARYLGLNASETEYFLDLVIAAKAGTEDLREYFGKRIKQKQETSLELSQRVPGNKELKDHERGVFYSNWFYSGIRLLTSLPGDHSVDTIAGRFGLPRKLVNQALAFLLSTGLCVKRQEQIRMGPNSTHLDSGSPLVSRLHANWRLKAIEHHPHLSGQSFAYTGPVSIRKSDAKKIRAILVEAIEKASLFADCDDPDALFCLNVDWFEF
jgi:hypothetical protein